MTDFKELLKQFKSLGFPDGEYAVFGSGPMIARGIKEGGDLDITVKDNLFIQLAKKYPVVQKDNVDYIEIADDIEVYPARDSGFDEPDEVIKRAELIGGVRFILLSDVIKWKKKKARPKDIEHIRLIESYLKTPF